VGGKIHERPRVSLSIRWNGKYTGDNEACAKCSKGERPSIGHYGDMLPKGNTWRHPHRWQSGVPLTTTHLRGDRASLEKESLECERARNRVGISGTHPGGHNTRERASSASSENRERVVHNLKCRIFKILYRKIVRNRRSKVNPVASRDRVLLPLNLCSLVTNKCRRISCAGPR